MILRGNVTRKIPLDQYLSDERRKINPDISLYDGQNNATVLSPNHVEEITFQYLKDARNTGFGLSMKILQKHC